MEGYTVGNSDDGKLRLEVGLVRDDDKSENGFLHVRVSAVEAARRSSVNVICLVDTSGSMSDDVVIQNAKGERESTSLNLLDLARHAVATVAHGLNKDDMVAIVGWSSSPDKGMLLTHMDADGQKKADKCLNELYPSGSTAMIEAIKKGFELVVNNGNPNIIYLLTDGRPNARPLEGFGSFVRNLMEVSKAPVQLNTLGFGYSVDSKLLSEIAEAGRGTFAFIPDGGLLGTVLVNSIANTVSVAFSDAQVSVDLCDGVSFADKALQCPKGSMDAPIRNADGTVAFNIGPINYEQPRSVVLPVKVAPGFAAGAPVASISVCCNESGKRVTAVVEDAATQVLPAMRASYAMAAAARAKTMFADTLFIIVHENFPEGCDALSASSAAVKACAGDIRKLLERVGTSAQISDILRDCEGQASEAVSKPEWYNRWGLHYLRSLCSAHEYELCNNFKDPGVQHYGGAFFASVRDDLDDIFQKLPAPEHHGYGYGHSYGYSSYSSRPTSSSSSSYVSMSRFMDASMGCFAGSCSVTMADGSSKRVSDVRKGDVVRTGSKTETTATVIASVQTATGGDACVFSPSGLIITPWHPVDIDGDDKWSFPANCSSATRQHTDEPVFTFVLDAGHSVLVNGVRCVTLAHGITTGSDARAHTYFGSNACIDDLKKYFADDYAAGYVKLPANCVPTRDPVTNRVNGISLK